MGSGVATAAPAQTAVCQQWRLSGHRTAAVLASVCVLLGSRVSAQSPALPDGATFQLVAMMQQGPA